MTVRSDVRWLLERVENGRIVFRIGATSGNRIAEWPTLARLSASHDGRVASFEAMPGVDPDVITKLRNGAVAGLLAHLRGQMALHAACFALERRAVACLGLSGAGKSTAVADACLRGGAALVSDDVLVVEPGASEFLVSSREESHWLTPPSLNALVGCMSDAGKTCVDARPTCAEKVPLAALVWLEFSESVPVPELRPLRRSEVFQRVLTAVVRFALDDQDAIAREFDVLSRLCDRVPGFTLTRPHDLEFLGRARRLLFDLTAIGVTAEGSH